LHRCHVVTPGLRVRLRASPNFTTRQPPPLLARARSNCDRETTIRALVGYCKRVVAIIFKRAYQLRMRPKKPTLVVVTTRLTEQLAKQLRERAAAEDRALQSIVMRALALYLSTPVRP